MQTMRWSIRRCVVLSLGIAASAMAPGALPAAPGQTPSAECASYCASIDADCSRAARDQARQCSRDAATGGVDPFTGRRDASAYYCGFFADDRNCRPGQWHDGCVQRFRARELMCADAYGHNHASEYMGCQDVQQNALAMCRDELAVCRSSC